MAKSVFSLPRSLRKSVDTDSILNSLVSSVLVIDEEDHIAFVNGACEQLLGGSAKHLSGQSIKDFLPADNPMFALIDQVRNHRTPVSEYGVTLESPRVGRHFVNLHATPLVDHEDFIVLLLQERSVADHIDRQLTHKGAARSVTAMAAMLAHEIKNPMSGIRGAAQLLEENLSDEDKPLAQLIRDETDRVVSLVDRMDAFSGAESLEKEAINIHTVLNRVIQLAQTGFGKNVRFVASFDPSLPLVLANKDQLVQVFINLVKNAAEAVPNSGGEVIISSSYVHGIRFAVPGSNSRVTLPLMISIQDNGPGIPEDLKPYLFDPFVTSKPNGSGLGLAQVAKIIDDHGGIIEFDSQPRRTVFRVMLPIAAELEPPTPANKEASEP